MLSSEVLSGSLTGCNCRLPQRLRLSPRTAQAQARVSHLAQPAHHSEREGHSVGVPSRCTAAQRRRLQPTRAFYDKWLNSDSPEKTRKQYQKQVDQINSLAKEVASLSDDDLRARTAEFRRRYDQGESLDELLVEVFAVRQDLVAQTRSTQSECGWPDPFEVLPQCSHNPTLTQVVREASDRVLGLRPFDVQLIGGMVSSLLLRFTGG